jgi:hypothetical protein
MANASPSQYRGIVDAAGTLIAIPQASGAAVDVMTD